MKLVVRADDYGYTNIHNLGTIQTIEHGIITHVDMMLDTPGTVDAMERIRKYPWISIGWHAHFWGSPVLPAKQVPSMVNEVGRFKFRKDQSLKKTVVFEEALAECRAQVERCIQIVGRAPDVAGFQSLEDNVFEQARKQCCDEFGITYGFMSKQGRDGSWSAPDEKYAHRAIRMPTQGNTGYRGAAQNDMNLYDPVRYFLEDEDNLLGEEIVISAWHPGYLDDYVMAESSFKDARVKDVEALCSPVLKQWLTDNHVELINMRDAVFGTSEYQNHQKVFS